MLPTFIGGPWLRLRSPLPSSPMSTSFYRSTRAGLPVALDKGRHHAILAMSTRAAYSLGRYLSSADRFISKSLAKSPQAVLTPFQILGGEAQVLQIMLKPEEKVIARTGSMCYMSETLQTETVVPAENVANLLWQWFFGRTNAICTFVNKGPQDGYIGLGAPSPARILPVDLAVFGGEITICQRDSFLCSINDVSITSVVTRRLRPGLFASEGFFMQKLVGRGLAFITAGGSIVQKNLGQGEIVVVDASCLVAMTSNVVLDLKYAGPLKRAFFGGDCLLHAHLTGPGVVFVQGLPFYRLAQRIARAVSAPHMRDNPRFFFQIAIFFFLAYVMIVSSLILTEQ